MYEAEGERERANRQLLDELRRQRDEIRHHIEAAQRTVAATRDAIARSQRLLAQIDGQIERTDAIDRPDASAE